MNQECESLTTCGFFKKHQETRDLACKGFILMYCKGNKMEQCKRREFKVTNGITPPDNMLPSGQMIIEK